MLFVMIISRQDIVTRKSHLTLSLIVYYQLLPVTYITEIEKPSRHQFNSIINCHGYWSTIF